jgi:TonB family protein
MRKLYPTLIIAICLSGIATAADAVARKLITRQDPTYPEIAKKMSLHGTVKLKVWIAPDGSVRRLEYIGGHPLLAESALKAVKGWKYEPAARESVALVDLRF